MTLITDGDKVVERTSMNVTDLRNLVTFAWKVGIVYFQVHDGKPNLEFYHAIGTLLPHERVVEIRCDKAESLKKQTGFRGKLPFFGAVTGGWAIDLTDNVSEAVYTVQEARRQAVLPNMPLKDDGPITVEGA